MDIDSPEVRRSGMMTDTTIISETGRWKKEAGTVLTWYLKEKLSVKSSRS